MGCGWEEVPLEDERMLRRCGPMVSSPLPQMARRLGHLN